MAQMVVTGSLLASTVFSPFHPKGMVHAQAVFASVLPSVWFAQSHVASVL